MAQDPLLTVRADRELDYVERKERRALKRERRDGLKLRLFAAFSIACIVYWTVLTVRLFVVRPKLGCYAPLIALHAALYAP